ncbi:MAG: dihydroxy-acid dehydratase, partial [Chloroflexales bacterium]|nr:dihydroxy-acid dehydratase [Chloroflexales bacterium]
MNDNRRSRIVTEGVQRTPNRAMLRAVGFQDEDFSKPIVGIANGYSNLTPCNDGLDVLSKAVASAIKTAGGMPMLYGTITIADGISMGTEGM